MHRAARRGEALEAPARPVRVDAFDLLRFEPPDFEFLVRCSSGTYVRVLVADVGTAVGCGAHLTRLRRTTFGPFDLREAVTLGALGRPLPVEEAIRHLPSYRLDTDDEARAAANGRPLAPAGLDGPYAVLAPSGSLVAVYRDEHAKAVPEMVLAPAPVADG